MERQSRAPHPPIGHAAYGAWNPHYCALPRSAPIEKSDAIFRSFDRKYKLGINCIFIAILYVYNSIRYLIMYLLLIIIIISKCTQSNYVNYIEENDAIFRSFEGKCRLEFNCISITIKLYVYNSICYLIMYLSSVIVIIFICIFFYMYTI